ncbi:MAG: SMP-30/gluconolactonase/LRE family protein [Chloroflexi bacterium]|nr:SMP-30/gluconolactonase/LRE family protein [Chloroflexota bacterium]
MVELEHLVASQSKLGEGPVWHPQEQALYWLDILQGRLHRYDSYSHGHVVVELGMVVSAMGIRQNGGMVMATKKGFAFWDPTSGRFDFIDNPDPDESDNVRFNDGKTDRQGRFWAGKMGGSGSNSLFRLDPDCSTHRMENGISTSNGLGWSPDNRLMYFTDSDAKVIYVYDFDPQTGEISRRRDFAHIPDDPREGLPDGLAVDSQGYIWSARWGGWKIVRYAPDGSIDREIPMPVEFPTSCTFGGPDLTDLYITSAWVEVQPGKRGEQPMAGDVFRLKTEVQGLPEPYFMG